MLFAALFSMPIDFSGLIWVAIAIGAFFVVSKYFGAGTAINLLTTLAPRAMDLMRFIDSLGLPLLSPVLKAAGEGRWKDIPAAIHTLFDQLDEKATRRQVLENLAKTLVRDQLGEPWHSLSALGADGFPERDPQRWPSHAEAARADRVAHQNV